MAGEGPSTSDAPDRTPTPPVVWEQFRDPATGKVWYSNSADETRWFFVEAPGAWALEEDSLGRNWRNRETDQWFYIDTGTSRRPFSHTRSMLRTFQ